MKLLLPFAWLYAGVMFIRNKLFDWGFIRPESAGVPVISVGNVTVGGTGKTPLVEYIASRFMEKGRRVAVVSRGYKRKSKGIVVVSDGKKLLASAENGGDEPVQIATRNPDLIVVVGERRVQAARRAVELGAEFIVLDDGFQHRHMKRDVDIAVVDATCDITRDAVLPAGRLRESLHGLRRANILAISRSDSVSMPGSLQMPFNLADKLRPYFAGPCVKYRYRMCDVRRGTDDTMVPSDVVKKMKLVAFSGIGNHEAFTHDLKKNGFTVLDDRRFADHHPYSYRDAITLASRTAEMKADACITTEKDMVRLRSDNEIAQKLFGETSVFYVTIAVEIVEGNEILQALIEDYTGQRGKDGHWDQ